MLKNWCSKRLFASDDDPHGQGCLAPDERFSFRVEACEPKPPSVGGCARIENRICSAASAFCITESGNKIPRTKLAVPHRFALKPAIRTPLPADSTVFPLNISLRPANFRRAVCSSSLKPTKRSTDAAGALESKLCPTFPTSPTPSDIVIHSPYSTLGSPKPKRASPTIPMQWRSPPPPPRERLQFAWCCSRGMVRLLAMAAASYSTPTSRAARAVNWQEIRRPRCCFTGSRCGVRCGSKGASRK